MPENFDFKKEWEKTKKQMVKFSKEAAVVAKKGEEELIKFSHQSKLHIDATAASLKKERLYYLIGKEYVGAMKSGKQTAKLKKLLDEVETVDKEQNNLQGKMKSSKKKSAK